MGLVLMVFIPADVKAGANRLIPFLELQEKYNDNIFLESKDPAEDFQTILSGGLSWDWRSERLTNIIFSRFDINRYLDYSDLDAVDQQYRLNLDYQTTERFGLSGSALYLRDSQPDRDLDVTGIVFSAVRRERQNYTGGASWRFDETTIGSVNCQYSREDFDSSDSYDTESHGIGISIVHSHTPTVSSRGVFQYTHSDYFDDQRDDKISTVDYYAVQLGLKADLKEKWSLDVSGGVRYNESEYDVTELVFDGIFPRLVTTSKKSDSWGGVGQVSLGYHDQYFQWNLKAAHDVSTVSGQDGPIQKTSLTTYLSRKLNYELSSYLSVGFFFNKSDDSADVSGKTDEKTWHVSPGLTYRFNEDIELRAGYRFTHYDDRTADDTAERNLVFLQFRVQYPFVLN